MTTRSHATGEHTTGEQACKFQSSMDGDSVLVYSRDRKTIFGMARGDAAKAIIAAVGLPATGGKVFAMAEFDDEGHLAVGDILPDQGW